MTLTGIAAKKATIHKAQRFAPRLGARMAQDAPSAVKASRSTTDTTTTQR